MYDKIHYKLKKKKKSHWSLAKVEFWTVWKATSHLIYLKEILPQMLEQFLYIGSICLSLKS